MDITVSIIFHREAAYAIPALASMERLVSVARASGLSVETRALMDKADKPTIDIVHNCGSWLDSVQHVEFGDLGLTRNAGTQLANGEFLAFLDGDDLWGSSWLTDAYTRAAAEQEGKRSIWHPECLFYFDEGDYDRHSIGRAPRLDAKSFYLRHRPSDTDDFNINALFLNNLWTANVFAHRSIHERYPYKAVYKELGFGVEDWSWNIETLTNGLVHRVVSDTVHLIRVKYSGSLGQANSASGLLPHVPDLVFPILGPR